MNLEQATRLKDLVSKTAAVFFILLVLCGLDGAIAYLRTPFNSLRMLPGESMRLTGPVPQGTTSPDQMTFESTSQSASVAIDEIISGFFLGGQMWRGTLRLESDIQPGLHVVAVFGKADRQKAAANVFQVTVYLDKASYVAGSLSLLQRITGISPWAFSASFFGLVLLCCAGLVLIGRRRDRLMAEEGEAEVFLVLKDELGFAVYFGLGERHGVTKGSPVLLMDGRRRPIEELTVETASEKDAFARVGPLGTVRTGYLVRKL